MKTKRALVLTGLIASVAMAAAALIYNNPHLTFAANVTCFLSSWFSHRSLGENR